ncbi:MAG TPA: HAD-IA family hydrolase, partial [Nannocystis sp.]
VAFDLIGVLAEPSWREIDPDPDRERWRLLRIGAIEEDDFWDSSAAAAYRACLHLRPERLALLVELRARGHRIAVATNFARAWIPVVRARLPDPALVDLWLVSGELGVAKPDPRFWAPLCRLGAPIVVVDDQPANLASARAAGLRAVWALPGADLRARLLAALSAVRPPDPVTASA